MVYPTLEEAARIAGEGDYQAVPISMEIYSDSRTPIEVLRSLKKVSRHCYILESVEQTRRWGRYTFLGYEPRLEITCLNHQMTIKSGITQTKEVSHPGAYIREILRQYKSPRLTGLPPFTGGLVGYFSYDYIKYSEPVLKLGAKDSEGFCDVDLMLFDKVIAFDHLRQKIILIVNARTDDLKTAYPRAVRELKEMAALVRDGEKAKIAPLKLTSDYRHLFSKEEYCGMVNKAKNHIREGDIFQVVLSNRVEADMEGSLFDLYRVLRTTNPSPYMFYFSSDDIEIAGASPETLVKLEDGKLYTYPLAGTRPRGATVTYAKELMHGKTSVITVDTGSVLFGGFPKECKVARCHSLAADRDTIPPKLRVTGQTQDGQVMAVEHAQYPVYGVQFHPESVLTEMGAAMIKNLYESIA